MIWGMDSIRVQGIGDTRRPIARVIMEYMSGRVGEKVPGSAIRSLFMRSGIDTWEGSKVLGILRGAGVIGVVEERDGAGALTWRRTYTKLGDWDDSVQVVEFADTTPHQKRAYETPGRWIRLPENVGMKGLNNLRDLGFDVSYFIRYTEVDADVK